MASQYKRSIVPSTYACPNKPSNRRPPRISPIAEKVVTTSEIIRLRDMFGHQRLREQKYTAGQIDTRWSDEIEKDFSQWLNDHIDELPVPKEQVQEYLKTRTW